MGIYLAIVGLVADVITIYGLFTGFVVPGSGWIPSREIIAVVSMTLLIFFESVILIYVSRKYESNISKSAVKSRDSTRETAVVFIWAYLLWVPTFVLWQLWFFQPLSGFLNGLMQIAVVFIGVVGVFQPFFWCIVPQFG